MKKIYEKPTMEFGVLFAEPILVSGTFVPDAWDENTDLDVGLF